MTYRHKHTPYLPEHPQLLLHYLSQRHRSEGSVVLGDANMEHHGHQFLVEANGQGLGSPPSKVPKP